MLDDDIFNIMFCFSLLDWLRGAFTGSGSSCDMVLDPYCWVAGAVRQLLKRVDVLENKSSRPQNPDVQVELQEYVRVDMLGEALRIVLQSESSRARQTWTRCWPW